MEFVQPFMNEDQSTVIADRHEIEEMVLELRAKCESVRV